MRVCFAGSGDAFGSGGRWQTCMHLTDGGTAVLVDCGATSMVALKTLGLDPNAVNTVVISHLHGDHFGGLPYLILDGQFSRRTQPLLVAGPPGTAARLTQEMETQFPGSSQVQRRFEVKVTELPVDGTPVKVGDAVVRGWEVDHACGAPPLAVRVEFDGAAFAYSGDTQWTPALVEAAKGADLFATEAYTFERQIRYHLDYLTLREHLCELGAARIMLTHMSPDMLQRLPDTDLPTAHDGLAVTL